MGKSTKKFVIRLYATHDIDLLALSYNPSVSFSKIALAAIRGYVRNIPVGDGWSFNSPVRIEVPGKISSRQYTIYLDTQSDADVIDYLNSVTSINGILRYAIRYYLREARTPNSDITKTLFDLPVSDIKAPTPMSHEHKKTIELPVSDNIQETEPLPPPAYIPVPAPVSEPALTATPSPLPVNTPESIKEPVQSDEEDEFQSKKNPTEGFGENFMALFGAGFNS